MGDGRAPLSVLILTLNEESNLARTLDSVRSWVERVVIVDSYSTDRTVEIARQYGCEILQNTFVNYAAQLNWGLERAAFHSGWVMRLDADERVTPELREALVSMLPTMSPSVSGIYVRRRVYFMGRWMRHGGYYPTWLLRVWKSGAASCEVRWMDEHMKLREGGAIFLKRDIIDENNRPLSWWIDKHNRYATREAIDVLNSTVQFLTYDRIASRFWGSQDERRRWLKEHLYLSWPPFLRAFGYFAFRYIIRLGFLDRGPGLIWHFLQGCWYRFLVDAKVLEIERVAKREHISTKEAIRRLHGIEA